MKHKEYQRTLDESVKIFTGAIVIGDVTLKKNVSIWFNAVLRGDMAPIFVGENTNIQDNAVVHTNTNLPTHIGANVTVGHNAIIHAATVGDYCLIGMGSILLDGCVIEEGAMVAAGTVVPPRKVVPARHLAIGNPMKIVRELTEEEIKGNLSNTMHYVTLMEDYQDE
ncbi:MAG: gamma carbonic anhydrase family protein [Candidatus Izemoplasmatales bacterium]